MFGSSIVLVLFIHPRVLRMLPGIISPLMGRYFRCRRLEQTCAQRLGATLPVARH